MIGTIKKKIINALGAMAILIGLLSIGAVCYSIITGVEKDLTSMFITGLINMLSGYMIIKINK